MVKQTQQKWAEGIIQMGKLMFDLKKLNCYTQNFLKDLYAFDS